MKFLPSLLNLLLLATACAQSPNNNPDVSNVPESALPGSTWYFLGADASPVGATRVEQTWVEVPKGAVEDFIAGNIHPTLVVAGDALSFTFDPDGSGPQAAQVVAVGGGGGGGTDDQTISLSGNLLTLEDGGTVDLTPYLGSGASGVINFEEEGGVEGAGASLATGQANWALLKTLETQADSSGLPIHFPDGSWRLDPTVPSSWASIYDSDYIEWDGPTTLTGAGKTATTLILPSQGFYQLFRQRTWDGDLTIKDLTITSGAPFNATFTVDPATDIVTVTGHGYLNAVTSLKFTSTGALPSPLNDGRAVPIIINANSFFLAGETGSYGLLSPRSVVGNAGTDTIDLALHGYANGTPLAFYSLSGGTLPGGISEGQRYYVVNATANTYQISLTPGGGLGVINITTTGTGSNRSQDILNLTDAGTGPRTVWALTPIGVVSAGYHIGATSGSGLDTGLDRVGVNFKDAAFHYISAFDKTNCNSAVDLTIDGCLATNNTGVFATIGATSGGIIENSTFLRPFVKVTNSVFIGVKETLATPFGNHFFYTHSVANANFTGNTLQGCLANAIQFQDENTVIPAGLQLVSGNNFDNNLTHIYGAQAEDKRSALNVVGNSFRRDGGIQLRGDAMVSGNYMEVKTTPAINITSTPGDVAFQPDVLTISGNTFVIKSVSGANAVFSFLRNNEHALTFAGNTIKRDPDLVGTVYLGTVGDISGGSKPRLIFRDNLYDITNGDEFTSGWFMYEGNYSFDNEKATNVAGFAISQAAGDSSTATFNHVTLDTYDHYTPTIEFGLKFAHSGWIISGQDNKFLSGCFQRMTDDAYLFFGGGRNLTPITAAATVYIDPSFNEHVVTGTTTINTIDIGVSGNIAANAAGVNHNDAWSGSITMIVPSGLTFSAAGNIANGPYTTTTAEAITFTRTDADAWLIKK